MRPVRLIHDAPRAILLGGDADDLTADPFDGISDHVRTMLGYLHRLKARMEATGCPFDDELNRLVSDAENAMHRLRVDVQYRSCADQVGRKRKT